MAIKKKALEKEERVASVLDSAVKEEVVQDEKEEERVAEVKSKKSVDVYDNDRLLIRTYSEEFHGKDYKTLAQQFADKKVYTLK